MRRFDLWGLALFLVTLGAIAAVVCVKSHCKRSVTAMPTHQRARGKIRPARAKAERYDFRVRFHLQTWINRWSSLLITLGGFAILSHWRYFFMIPRHHVGSVQLLVNRPGYSEQVRSIQNAG